MAGTQADGGHDWVDAGEVVAVGYIGGLPPDLHRMLDCKRCGQGNVVPVEPGYTGGFVVGLYSRWDGVSTCEDVIARDAKCRAEAIAAHEQRLRQIAAELPRRQAFVAALNALCAEHGASVAEGDYGERIDLSPRTYELSEDGVSVR